MSKDLPSQSGGVSHGDNAQGQISITGEVKGDIVFGDKYVYEAPLPTVKALHQLPSPPADFTGREAEIAELLAVLEDASLTILGVQGMGGVGKTALALKLAEKIKDRYPGGQFYLDLMGVGPRPLTPAEVMAHVVHSYHPGAKLPEGEAELRGRYLSVLHDRRALLLMDNTRDERQVEPLIPPAGCRLIVTSRQSFTLPGMFAKNLDCLPPADAGRLLLSIAPRIGDLAGDLAKLCGSLPLALRLAASAIAKFRNLTPADYLRRLTDARKRLELIEASLGLSYEILSEELRPRWRVLAVFPDSFNEAAAAAVWETAADQARETLGDLLSFSLVEWIEVAGRYRLHDLARVFADSRLSDAERDGGRRLHARHYQAVLSAAEHLYQQGGERVKPGLGLYDLERTNIEAGQAWAAARAGGDEAAAELCIVYPAAGTEVLALRQRPHEYIGWLEAMLAAARSLNRRGMEGRALGELGLAHFHLGATHRALEFFEQALAIARELGDRRDEGQALGNQGMTYYALGEMRRALEFFERAMVIARELGDRRDEGQILSGLGMTYYVLGETRRALEFLNQCLEITRETGDRRSEGQALGNLGLAYINLGETRRALEFFEQATVIARETGDPGVEGNALWNMALALHQLGDRAQAIMRAEAALVLHERLGAPQAEMVRKVLAEWKAGAGREPSVSPAPGLVQGLIALLRRIWKK